MRSGSRPCSFSTHATQTIDNNLRTLIKIAQGSPNFRTLIAFSRITTNPPTLIKLAESAPNLRTLIAFSRITPNLRTLIKFAEGAPKSSNPDRAFKDYAQSSNPDQTRRSRAQPSNPDPNSRPRASENRVATLIAGPLPKPATRDLTRNGSKQKQFMYWSSLF